MRTTTPPAHSILDPIIDKNGNRVSVVLKSGESVTLKWCPVTKT